MELLQGITQPANDCSGRSGPLRLLSVAALFGLLFLPVLANGAEVVLQHTDFTANCTLTPDALVHRSDEFFCGDQPLTIQCDVTLASHQTQPFVLALTFSGEPLADFPTCYSCNMISGESTLLAIQTALSKRITTETPELYFFLGVDVTQFNPPKFSKKGKLLERVLLFPPYALISLTLVMSGHHSAGSSSCLASTRPGFPMLVTSCN